MSYSAFGIDHGYEEVGKGFNPLSMFRGGGKAAAAGRHSAGANPIFDEVARKHGLGVAPGGGKRIASAPGKHKGTYKKRSFLPNNMAKSPGRIGAGPIFGTRGGAHRR